MGQRRQWLQPDLRRIEVDGIAVAVETVRNGPEAGPVVAWVHGLGSASTLAFGQVARHPALRGVTSLLIDLPGHGLSGKPDDWTYTIEDHANVICSAVAALATMPVTLVSHSMGGSIAIVCAASQPGMADRLVVAEPNLDPGDGATSGHIAHQDEDRFINRGYRALMRATEGEGRSGEVEPLNWLETMRIASPRALHRSAVSLRAERTPTFRQLLEGLSIPCWRIVGALTPPLECPLERDIPTHVIPEAGHLMMVGNPDAFAAMVAGILGLPPR